MRVKLMNGAMYPLRKFWRWSGLHQLTGKTAVIALPYGWHILFFFVPFLIVLKISFSESLIGSPPYTSLFTWIQGHILQIRLNLSNYTFLFEDELYIASYLASIKTSGLATLICLIVGYPMAYGITRAPRTWRTALLMLVILPFWSSFLIRVYSWIGLLNNQGLINSALLKLGLIQEPLSLIHNDFAVCLGIVYSYLPFMILPLYSSLEKIDPLLFEASYDLGSKPLNTFFKITLPLSIRGALGGAMLVFIPGVGEFVIPEILGGSDSLMIGKILWGEFFINRDWPLACALAIVMLVVLVVPILVLQKLLSQEEES